MPATESRTWPFSRSACKCSKAETYRAVLCKPQPAPPPPKKYLPTLKNCHICRSVTGEPYVITKSVDHCRKRPEQFSVKAFLRRKKITEIDIRIQTKKELWHFSSFLPHFLNGWGVLTLSIYNSSDRTNIPLTQYSNDFFFVQNFEIIFENFWKEHRSRTE